MGHWLSHILLFSTGGMLLQKLDTTDLQFERMTPFDGAMAYAQNKRQQVVMTDHWANKYKDVHFSTMHPGINFLTYLLFYCSNAIVIDREQWQSLCCNVIVFLYKTEEIKYNDTIFC